MQSLIAQLHTRYPMGSLIAELLTIHDDYYIVRAVVQVGGISLSSGMASASSIEAAEDRAKVRALEALGISSTSSSLPPPLSSYAFDTQSRPNVTSEPLQDFASAQVTMQPISEADAIALPDSANISPSTADLLATASVRKEIGGGEHVSSPAPLSDFGSAAPTGEPPLTVPNLEPEDPAPTPVPKPTRSTRNGKQTEVEVEPLESVPASPEMVDNSDIIAQTDVQLRRLGWGKDQGRKHIQLTYGKRSRQQLTDTELLDFLRYLEAQP